MHHSDGQDRQEDHEICPRGRPRRYAAEKLAGSVAGTVLSFSFHAELELVVDPSLLANDELFFNAARLDRSMVLKTSDYTALAKPRLERIAQARGT